KNPTIVNYPFSRARWSNWLERESTDQKVRGLKPTSTFRLPLSRLGQPGSILALVSPSGGMAVRHRKVKVFEKTLVCESIWFLRESQLNLSFVIFYNWMCCTQAASRFSWRDIRDSAV
ncbi:hypothetical protein T265_14681, partial [Opisthorchis viverrini]